ncbi:hypothetical protein ABPG77_011184 [Micractinium sp. CCAP 211/92]
MRAVTLPMLAMDAASTRMLGAAQRGGHTVAVDTAGTHLHETARDGPQPETLFRPDVFALSSGHAAAAAAGSGGRGEGAKPLKEGELPGFGGLPVGPDYGAERPQEQAAPEPDNPLPGDLPPNHPKREGEEAPEGPGPVEVPSPRRDEPDVPLRPPPEIVPSPGPAEVPPPSIPSEAPTPSVPPEFTPRTPTEVPQRGGSEISFPGSEVNFP